MVYIETLNLAILRHSVVLIGALWSCMSLERFTLIQKVHSFQSIILALFIDWNIPQEIGVLALVWINDVLYSRWRAI